MTFRRPVVWVVLAAVGVASSSNVGLSAASSSCGDGVLEVGENCDDGNVAPIDYANGDFCAADCSGVDLTGQLCSDDRLHQALTPSSRPESLGSLVRFPPNSTVRLCDCDGDGVAVRLGAVGYQAVLIEGQGVHLIFNPPTNQPGCSPAPTSEVTVVQYENSAQYGTLRDAYVASTQGKAKLGIDATSHRLLLHNVFVNNMVTGIRLDGDVRNSNSARWQNIVVTSSDNGIVIDGTDSGGALFRGFEITGYTGVGLKARGSFSTAHVGHNIGPSPAAATAISDYRDANRPSAATHVGPLLGINVDGNAVVQLNGTKHLVVGGNLAARADAEVLTQRVGAENARLGFTGPNGADGIEINIPKDTSGVFSVGPFGLDQSAWILARRFSPKRYSLYRPNGPIDLMSWSDATHATGVGNLKLGSNLCEVVSQCP